MRKRLGLLDLPVAALLLVAFWKAPAWLAGAGGGSAAGSATEVLVVASGVERVEPLTPSRQLVLRGPLGETRVQLGPDRARFLSSPCPGQLCVGAGALTRPGQGAACVPNRVALRLTGQAEGGVDAVSH